MNTIIYKTLIAGCFLLTSCSGCRNETPFDPKEIEVYGKDLPNTLTAYNKIKAGLDEQGEANTPALYIDFSAGMFTAFGTPLIKDLMAQCFNAALVQNVEVYRLAQGQVAPLQVNNSTQLGQMVSDPKQYLDRRAPIQAAVEKIVSSGKDALLVTDFEEWQDNAEVGTTAYLKIPFSKWLSTGNSVSFFIADYKEGTVNKHIYFTVFTYGKAHGHSMINKLRPKLSALPAKFDLATDTYTLSTDYTGSNAGGIFRDPSGKSDREQNLLDLQPTYLNGLTLNQPFEFYPLGVSWSTIAELHKDYAQENQFNDLFKKLYIDLQNTDSYIYGGFEIKTYDVTGDFERFAQSLQVKKHKPKINKGSNGENKISDQKDRIAQACYNQDGSLKSAYVYKPQDTPLINDVFNLNKDLFKNTLQTYKTKAEVGISFSPQFAASKIPKQDGLVKITLNAAQVSVNTANPVLEKFKWLSKNGTPNVSLYESIKSTLDEVKPANKVIYAYYIKTTEQ